MRTNEEIRGRIMRGVYRVYLVRQIGRPAVRAGIFAVALLSVLSFVSVPDVIANTAGVRSVSGFLAFFLSAFLKTELFVQVAVLAAGLVALWTTVDTVKNFSTGQSTRSA